MNRETDPLDRLLSDWAAQYDLPAERFETLQHRIATAIERLPAETEAQPHVPQRRQPRGRFHSWALLASVAVVLVACVWLIRPPDRPIGVAKGPQAVVLAASLDQRVLDEKARLFARLQQVFDDRLSWVAETDNDVRIGLTDRADENGERPEPVAVRLVVTRRKTAEPDWTPVRIVDVVSRPEEVIDVGPEEGIDGRLSVWVYRLPDGMLMVETNLALAELAGLQLSHSGLQRPGTSEVLYSTQAEQVEYQILQTVVPVGLQDVY